jgi:hypothetical protein
MQAVHLNRAHKIMGPHKIFPLVDYLVHIRLLVAFRRVTTDNVTV